MKPLPSATATLPFLYKRQTTRRFLLFNSCLFFCLLLAQPALAGPYRDTANDRYSLNHLENYWADTKHQGTFKYQGVAHALGSLATCGLFLPTAEGARKMSHYEAFSLRYSLRSTGSSWEDLAYNMPFYGFGVEVFSFKGPIPLGKPISLYLFSGSTLRQFTPRLGLSYEWNLGLSMNWNPYDPFDNRQNDLIGSPQNVHVGFKFFVDYALTNYFDLKIGVNLTHFSNGSSQQPNLGINLGGAFINLMYNFKRPDKSLLIASASRPPENIRHLDHEIMFLATARQTTFSTDGTGLPSPYVSHKFKVFGVTYAPMIVENYRYKWGPSLELVYDESSQARAWRELNPVDGRVYDRVKPGPFWHRMQLGLSIRGEIAMPIFSIFANMGYDIIHQHHRDPRFYQIVGLKVYLKENLFGAFGIRAAQFSQAQYLYWNIGYTLSQFKRKI